MKNSVARPLVLVSVCLLVMGCWGPHYDPEELELEPVVSGERITGVVVTDFHQSRQQVSETSSGDVVTIREALSAHDIAFDIASGIRKRGVPARPVKGASVAMLQPGEVLVRGSIRASARQMIGVTSDILFGMTIATLGVYGIFTPYFYPMQQGSQVDVHIEIVDRGGNVLLSSEQRVNVFNKSLHLATWFDDTDAPPALRILQDKVAAAIVRSLERSTVSGPAPQGVVLPPPNAPTRLSPVAIALRAKQPIEPTAQGRENLANLLLDAVRGPDGEMAINMIANSVVYGIDINTTTDSRGRNALILAVVGNKVQVVQYLLSGDLAKAGQHVDTNVRDHTNRSALDHARARHNTALIRLLEQRL